MVSVGFLGASEILAWIDGYSSSVLFRRIFRHVPLDQRGNRN